MTKLTRRGFVAVNAAAAATLATSQGANAFCAKGHATETVRADWMTASARELEPFIGDRFRVSSPQAGDLVLRLVAVEPANSGSDRPTHLPRKESVIAVFDSPDKAPLVDCGHATHTFRHHVLGTTDLFAGPVCNRAGDHMIEVALG